jgi:hypothetical protein
MPTVNGTLKVVSAAKSGKGYNLKGDWDDGEEWKYIEAQAAKILAEEGLVVRDGKWQDGNPKYKVIGEPHIGIITTFHGKGNPPTHKIILNGQKPAASSTTDAQVDTSWLELEHDYQAALDIAIRAWERLSAKTPENAVLQAAAATVLIEASKRGLRGAVEPPEATPAAQEPPDLEEFPEALDEEDDDLPF